MLGLEIPPSLVTVLPFLLSPPLLIPSRFLPSPQHPLYERTATSHRRRWSPNPCHRSSPWHSLDRYEPTNLSPHFSHPPTVDTAKQNQSTLPLSSLTRPLTKSKALTVQKGAHTPLFAATSETITRSPKIFKGAYLVPFGDIHEPSETASDMALAKRLWEATERVIVRIFTESPEQPLL